MAKEKPTENIVVAKTDDGSVTLTFILPWKELSPLVKKAIEKLGKDITVPGFRKGKAPMDIVEKHISRDQLVQEIIGDTLPPLITKAYKDYDIKPVMYPKVEMLHAHDGEDWEVQVTTAQFPEINLGDYKKIVKEALAKDSIWTPEKGKNEEKKEQTQEDKEAVALKSLVEGIDIKLPRLLVEEEANQRIANLLGRIEKLGLSLDSYLASQKKDAETLRAEYANQASEALKMELILGKIAEEEKVTVAEGEIEAFGQALMADPRRSKEGLTEEDKANIRTLLIKRKAIESLVS